MNLAARVAVTVEPRPVQISPQPELTARALLDLGTDDEHGKPAVADGGPGTGRMLVIDCGRRPGYLAERIGQLEDIARDAAVHGARVTWG